MPGRSRAASDIEQPQEDLPERAVYLEADRLAAEVKTHLDSFADEGTVVGGRKRDLVFEVAIERRNALAVPWIDGNAAAANRAEGRRGQHSQTSRHFADDARAGRPSLPVDRDHLNAAGPLAHKTDIILAHHGARGQTVAVVDHETDQLALLDETPGHVLLDRCHEHARA